MTYCFIMYHKEGSFFTTLGEPCCHVSNFDCKWWQAILQHLIFIFLYQYSLYVMNEFPSKLMLKRSSVREVFWPNECYRHQRRIFRSSFTTFEVIKACAEAITLSLSVVFRWFNLCRQKRREFIREEKLGNNVM